MEQFEITLIELNRHLAYEDKNSAINCYNKLNNTYNKILDSNIYHDQKNYMYHLLVNSHKKIVSQHQQIIGNSDVIFLTLFIFLSSLILLTGPEITAMFIMKQKPNIVKNIYIFSTFLFILIPTGIIYIKNSIKK